MAQAILARHRAADALPVEPPLSEKEQRRITRLQKDALAIRAWLEQHPKVARVYYPGLKSHDQHELAMRQQSGSGAAVVSFDVKGKTPEERRKNAFHVIDSTQVLSIATNLGDVKTIVTHPATTSQVEEDRRGVPATSRPNESASPADVTATRARPCRLSSSRTSLPP